jgi:carboxypeptidase C (cathepsin A)
MFSTRTLTPALSRLERGIDIFIFVALVLAAVSLPAISAAQAAEAAPEKTAAEKEKEKKPAEPEKPEVKPVVAQHEIRVDGKPLKYTSTAGYLAMKDEEGKLKANIFFVAYTKDGVSDVGRRPITFAFNGGPGSSSVWLHLGALGPRRVQMTDEGMALPPPYHLVDNESTWLVFSDLVFIDPVTTGYSRPATGEKAEQFHGVKEDIESVGDFIRLYTTRYQRWASPKFLAGESYGTTRAAGLSGYLQARHGMYLNGIVLVSSVLNFGTLEFNSGNDLPYVLYLPTFTATAWYHKKLPSDLQGDLARAVAESRTFAASEYTLALTKGEALAAAERSQIVEKLSRLTGLSKEFIELHNLRVKDSDFFAELLRKEHQIVGRLDSRFVGFTPEDRDDGGAGIAGDPSYAAIQGPFTAMLNSYVRGELRYENDLPYEILTPRVFPWTFPQNRYVNVAQTLRSAIEQNPSLKVFVAAGYYDVATPFFAAEYTVDHLGLDPSLRGNLSLDHFEAGHMMYIHHPSLVKLTGDVSSFYAGAVH